MEKYNESLKYKTWEKELKKNNIRIESVEEKYSVRKKNGEILFTLAHLDAKDEEGYPLLPIVLLRGSFVAVLTALREKESGKTYFLLVKQRRVATGGYFYEHPAGMCDSETDPYKVALKEVEEETGLTIQKEQLELIWDKHLYSSPGLLDEAGYFFVCEVEMSAVELDTYRDRITGAQDENERIFTFLCPEDEVFEYLENSNGVMLTLLYLQKRNKKANLWKK